MENGVKGKLRDNKFSQEHPVTNKTTNDILEPANGNRRDTSDTRRANNLIPVTNEDIRASKKAGDL